MNFKCNITSVRDDLIQECVLNGVLYYCIYILLISAIIVVLEIRNL